MTNHCNMLWIAAEGSSNRSEGRALDGMGAWSIAMPGLPFVESSKWNGVKNQTGIRSRGKGREFGNSRRVVREFWSRPKGHKTSSSLLRLSWCSLTLVPFFLRGRKFEYFVCQRIILDRKFLLYFVQIRPNPASVLTTIFFILWSLCKSHEMRSTFQHVRAGNIPRSGAGRHQTENVALLWHCSRHHELSGGQGRHGIRWIELLPKESIGTRYLIEIRDHLGHFSVPFSPFMFMCLPILYPPLGGTIYIYNLATHQRTHEYTHARTHTQHSHSDLC